jgi:hypothetical protein
MLEELQSGVQQIFKNEELKSKAIRQKKSCFFL